MQQVVAAEDPRIPYLLDGGAGTIVNIGSVNAALPDPVVMAYSAAKAAMANFAKALSKEVGPRGIRVNTISPGPVATALWLGSEGVDASLAEQSRGELDTDAVAKPAASAMVTGRFTRPEEVADLVLLLASGRAGTGADFTIDGGLVTTL